ncbi:hypothetical protein ACOBV8_21315 (plasmid) [Pseudoalteromonas espejiana]
MQTSSKVKITNNHGAQILEKSATVENHTATNTTIEPTDKTMATCC